MSKLQKITHGTAIDDMEGTLCEIHRDERVQFHLSDGMKIEVYWDDREESLVVHRSGLGCMTDLCVVPIVSNEVHVKLIPVVKP